MSGVHDFFDVSDARDIERADEFAERGGATRRDANTYSERKGWRDALLGRLGANAKAVR